MVLVTSSLSFLSLMDLMPKALMRFNATLLTLLRPPQARVLKATQRPKSIDNKHPQTMSQLGITH